MWPSQVHDLCVWTVIIIIGTLYLEVSGIATGNKAFPSLGDYISKELVNTTNATTLQSQIFAKNGHRTNTLNVDIEQAKGVDSVLSGSSHRRGLLPQEHPGYDGHEFDEVPHYGYNFAHPPAHFDTHYYEPHADFHNEYSLGHYHHKPYNPALTAKALLLPVAGLALLGAAAALVSNPVFLQLGVVTGRRRRDTEAISNTHENHQYYDLVKKLEHLTNVMQDTQEEYSKQTLDTTINSKAKRQHYAERFPIQPLSIQTVARRKQKSDNFSKDGKLVLIPIPLKFKDQIS